MADQPVTWADIEGITVALTAITEQLTALITRTNNLEAGHNQKRRGQEDHALRGMGRPPRTEDSSSEEEIVEEDPGEASKHDYRVKADIPLFYGTIGVEDFLDW